MALIQYKGSEMTVMQRIQGPCDPQILKDKIDALYIQDPRQRERQLREEQDEAYYRSLEADQEKEKRAKRERQEKVEAKEKEKQEKKRKEILQEKRAVYIRYLYTQLPEEPQEGKVTKLSFRLANGDRVVRLFSEQDSLDTLYRFVQVVPLLNEPIEPCEPPQDYEHQYTFKIHSPYPRIEYEASKSKKLVDISNLWPSANLVVEDE
ncbi:hypothetical protein G6F56_006858 [Rhizopus delemar]|nr:hypothetical protein G6F56_006858 [Rhizopus delemar]